MARGRPRKDQGDVLLKSAELIGWALGGIEREILQTRERLGALTAQAEKLRARLGRGRGRGRARATAPAAAAEPAAAGRTRGRREISAAGRRRISEMMKKRWAKAKREGKSRL
jgi:hypothetical protein